VASFFVFSLLLASMTARPGDAQFGAKRAEPVAEDPTANQFNFVDSGPPPDMRQRQLIFDSLQKIVNTVPQKQTGKEKEKSKDNRGTSSLPSPPLPRHPPLLVAFLMVSRQS
jgi:hypothetical protein